MRPYDYERMVEEVEELADSAPRSVLNAWVLGVVASIVLAVYGARCIGTRSAHFIEGKPARIVVLEGRAAISLGVAYVCAGLFLNLHFFWSWRRRYHGYAQIGKAVAAVGFCGGLACFIFSVLVFG